MQWLVESYIKFLFNFYYFHFYYFFEHVIAFQT